MMKNIKIHLMSFLIFFLISGCASLPDNSGKPVSHAYPEPETTSLGKKFKEHAATQAPGQSGFRLLSSGLDAFVARAVLAQLAEKSIDSQYYMVHSDLVGLLYIDQLVKAADRGVKVRFLLDDIDEGDRDFNLAKMDFHPNIEVRIFNPFGRNTGKTIQYLTGFGKQTRRAHNKTFTVDNIATILGGRNIGDEYFEAEGELDFADLDVLGVGPVAREVSASFDEYWNHSLSYPISLLSEQRPTEQDYLAVREKLNKFVEEQADSAYLKSLRESDLAVNIRARDVKYIWADNNVYADSADKLMVKTKEQGYQMLVDLKPYMEKAEKELFIISPYFVPGGRGTDFLIGLQERGVKVRILTNSLASTDVSVVHAGYARYRKPLLRAGVELWELNKKTAKADRKAVKKGKIGDSKTSLHAKTFIVDRDTAFIGSLNLDQRSVIQNTEIGVIVESGELAKMIADGLEKNLARGAFRVELEVDSDGVEHTTWHGLVDGKQTRLTTEPYTGFWKRFGTSFLRLMPIESQI